MNIVNLILWGSAALVLVVTVALLAHRFLPRRLKTDSFTRQWKDLQQFCRDRTTWPNALDEADRLLDQALKKRKFKGKSMGERMVSAQRAITNNDAMWYAHNLAKKLHDNPDMKLKEIDVKTALLGFRSALKDLGAIRTAKPKPDEPTEPAA